MWTESDILRVLNMHDKLLKGLFRERFTATLSRLGSRFLLGRSGATDNDDVEQQNIMAEFLAASPAVKERIATLMDPDTFASAMDRCHVQRNSEQGRITGGNMNWRCVRLGLTVQLNFVDAVGAHVSADDDQQLKKDFAALLVDGVVDLFTSELPDECYIVSRHEDFLAILPA